MLEADSINTLPCFSLDSTTKNEENFASIVCIGIFLTICCFFWCQKRNQNSASKQNLLTFTKNILVMFFVKLCKQPILHIRELLASPFEIVLYENPN